LVVIKNKRGKQKKLRNWILDFFFFFFFFFWVGGVGGGGGGGGGVYF